MRQQVSNVENGLKLALLIVGGLGAAIGLVALVGAAIAKSQTRTAVVEPCETC